MIAFTCPTCSKRYSVPDHHAGRRTKCRQCRGPLVVPAAADDPPWVKPAAASPSDGTAERAKTPTDADLVLPAAAVETPAPVVAPAATRGRTAAGRHIFVIELEFAGDPGPLAEEQSEVYREAREFLADMVYAYRRRLATNGARLKKVRVDGLERDV